MLQYKNLSTYRFNYDVIFFSYSIQIQFWEEQDKQGTLREWDVNPQDALAKRIGNTWRATIENLLPNTHIEGTVAVMNNYYVAAPSSPFKFKTKEGCELIFLSNLRQEHYLESYSP